MAEVNNITFTHKELAEILVKHRGIHEGVWGVYVEFGLQASNVGPTEENLSPAAIVPVLKVGIQKFKGENSLAVDAGKVNPKKNSKKGVRRKRSERAR